MNETFIEGQWESKRKCPKCGKMSVEGYRPWPGENPSIIWYDCVNCGAELGDGEEPHDHIPLWYDPRELKEKAILQEKEKIWQIYKSLQQELAKDNLLTAEKVEELQNKADKYDKLIKFLKKEIME